MTDEVLARYPIRTPPGYRVVLALLGVLAVAALGLLIPLWSVPRYSSGPSVLIFLLAMLASAPVWYVLSTKAYRIAGGSGEIVFYADRVEVVTGARSLVFAASTILIGAAPQIVRYRAWGVIPLGERRAGMLVVIASATQRFVFSSKVFPEEDWVPGFVEDIALVHAGQRPLGPRIADRVKPVSRSPDGYDYEAELDRELQRME